MFNKIILWIKFVMFTGHTPMFFNRVYSLLVSMDLDEPIFLGFCIIFPHGVILEIATLGKNYYISEKDNGFIHVVKATPVKTPSGLIIKDEVTVYHQGKCCNSLGWAWIVIAAHNELLKQNFYANRDKELSFNVVKLT